MKLRPKRTEIFFSDGVGIAVDQDHLGHLDDLVGYRRPASMAVGYYDDKSTAGSVLDHRLAQLDESNFVEMDIGFIEQPERLNWVKMCSEQQLTGTSHCGWIQNTMMYEIF